MQPEKLDRNNCLSWRSRSSCASSLLGQKPCSNGPTSLSFLLLLLLLCSEKKPKCYADKIARGGCVKENRNSPRPRLVSLSLFPVSCSLFLLLHFFRLFVDCKGGQAESPVKDAPTKRPTVGRVVCFLLLPLTELREWKKVNLEQYGKAKPTSGLLEHIHLPGFDSALLFSWYFEPL